MKVLKRKIVQCLFNIWMSLLILYEYAYNRKCNIDYCNKTRKIEVLNTYISKLICEKKWISVSFFYNTCGLLILDFLKTKIVLKRILLTLWNVGELCLMKFLASEEEENNRTVLNLRSTDYIMLRTFSIMAKNVGFRETWFKKNDSTVFLNYKRSMVKW